MNPLTKAVLEGAVLSVREAVPHSRLIFARLDWPDEPGKPPMQGHTRSTVQDALAALAIVLTLGPEPNR